MQTRSARIFHSNARLHTRRRARCAMWSHDGEDLDDARGLRKEDVDATTPRMSLRQRRRRSRHRALLFLGTCVALLVAFAIVRAGVREHRGARDRVDGGVDGDYDAHAFEPWKEESAEVRETNEERVPSGADRDGRSDDSVPTTIAGGAEDDDESASATIRQSAIRESMRRGAVVKQHRRRQGGGDDEESLLRDETRKTARSESSEVSSSGAFVSRLFRFFGGGDVVADAESERALRRSARRRVARLHVTRDPSTGHLTMNDVGSGAFAVSQPRACAPIASEADGEANSVTGAMVQLRTKFRVGKILRRCDATSASAFLFQSKGTSNNRDTRQSRESALNGVRDAKEVPSLPINPPPWEALLEDLNAGSKYGALCYTPDFLRGVASTLSVCSRNHEDGVALALLGFAGTKSGFGSRVLVSVSDAGPNAPERGASAYLVHNHRFAGAFVDASDASAEARRAHFRDRNVPNAKAFVSSADKTDKTREKKGGDTVSGAAAVVRGELQPSTIGAEIREALEALEGASEAEETAATDEEEKRRIRKKKTRRVEVDLLTLDVARDGLYLAQPALETVSPRLVAVSYDSAFGPERALASKPGSGFGGRKAFEEEESETETKTEAASSSSRASYRREGSAFGRPSPGLSGEDEEEGLALQISASLSAYLRVLERWGFHFVGCEAAGETAFFLRSDVIETAHRAGRGSVHVTTPSDSGCFSARAPRMAMKKWPRIEKAAMAKEQTFDVIDEAWLAAHAPGPPWRSDDAFLVGGAFAEEL